MIYLNRGKEEIAETIKNECIPFEIYLDAT